MLKREYLLELGIENILNYLRRSRQDEEMEKRTGEDTLKAQADLMHRVLEPFGIPYLQREELGSGDKISTRPVFQWVIEELRAKRYQAIAVKEISRMGRGSYTDMGVIYDLIVDNCIFIITPYKLYDPRNPSDLRQIRFELFMSREEFETTRERLVGGRVTNAHSGLWVAGKAPWGYTYNKQTRKLEIEEESAKIVRMIFDYYVRGIPTAEGKRREVSFRALATYFSKRTAINTPRGFSEWHPNALKELIKNDRYIGIQRYRTHKTVNGKRIPRPPEEHIVTEGAIPPIIDSETWDLAQAKIIESSHKPRTKMDFSPCELAGLCVCLKCGRRMVRQYSVQNYKMQDGTVSTYHKEFLWCTKSGCTFVKYRSVEEDLLHALKVIRDLDNGRMREVLAGIVDNSPAQKLQQSADEMRDYIAGRRKELKAREKFIFEKYETGRYTDEVFDERMAEIKEEFGRVDAMELDLEAMENNVAPVDQLDMDEARKRLSSILDAYNAADDKTERNTILRSVFDHVAVEIVEKGRGRRPAVHRIYPRLKINPFLA